MASPTPKRSLLRRTARAAIDALGFPGELRQSLVFELRSALGRRLSRGIDLSGPGPHLINLGSSAEVVPGFLNVDFFATPNVQFTADLRFPLDVPDASIDGIFTEHTLEHLELGQVERVLAECLRILKPGAWIRVIVPDVGEFARRYVAGDSVWFAEWEKHVLLPRGRRMRSPMEAISFVTQEYGHRSAWDAELMGRALRSAGFVDVRQVGHLEGSDARLLVDRRIASRTMLSLFMEARKRP